MELRTTAVANSPAAWRERTKRRMHGLATGFSTRHVLKYCKISGSGGLVHLRASQSELCFGLCKVSSGVYMYTKHTGKHFVLRKRREYSSSHFGIPGTMTRHAILDILILPRSSVTYLTYNTQGTTRTVTRPRGQVSALSRLPLQPSWEVCKRRAIRLWKDV